MLRADTIIALDIGASKLAVAEFSCRRGAVPLLLNYGIAPLGAAPDRETDVSAYVVAALREQMHALHPGPLYMSIAGQTVFPRFVKLPPVAGDKVLQMIQYEAEQNVPFPIEEVVWDYQILGGNAEGELNVMLVAVKLDSVTGATDCVQAAKLDPEVVDAAPMALYNAVRYNYPDLAGCTLVLDIGARSTNLIFLEEDRVFTRSVPVAGNTVTAEIAKDLSLSFEDAEARKKEGFVALGGSHASSDDQAADRVARIIRNVTTRLHAEVNRSINFYRGQQNGNAPGRVLLTGGSAVLPHLDAFFREKLRVPVDLFNPFANVAVGSGLSAERVSADRHLLGPVVGLALRHALKCPLEINLLPPALVGARRFRRRQSYFAFSAAGLVLLLLALWGFSGRMSAALNEQVRLVDSEIAKRQESQRDLAAATRVREAVEKRADSVVDIVALKTQWIEILDAIHGALLDGMWVTSLQPVLGEGDVIAAVEIAGRGFKDKLVSSEPENRTAVEVFRDRLRKAVCFAENTEIKRAPAPLTEAYDREFTILAPLKKPIEIR